MKTSTYFPMSSKNRVFKLILIILICSFLVIRCTSQTLTPENTTTPEIGSVIINGPPEPPAGYERGGIEDLGIQKIATDGSSLYYHKNGERLSLTPSFKWITIHFNTNDLNLQNDALQNISTFANIDQRFPLTGTDTLVLPLLSGLSIHSLIANINLLRTNTEVFSQVNPVFIFDGEEFAITDQFIATFSAEKDMDEINAINALFGITISSVEKQKNNSYILSIPPTLLFDVVTVANLYFEEGYAQEAIPLFIPIQK